MRRGKREGWREGADADFEVQLILYGYLQHFPPMILDSYVYILKS